MNKKAKHIAMLNLLDVNHSYYYQSEVPKTNEIGDRWFDSDSGFHSYHVFRRYKDGHIFPEESLGPDWVSVSSKEFYEYEN